MNNLHNFETHPDCMMRQEFSAALQNENSMTKSAPAGKNTDLQTRFALRGILLLAGFLLMTGQAARAQNALQQIRQRGTLVIGTDATYPPFEFKDGNTFRGFDIEIGSAIAAELGVKVQWINMDWSGVMGALETGKFDLVMSGVTITPERKKGLGFSRPYFLSGQTIVRKLGDTRLSSSKDLPGKVVAVQQETTGQYAAQKLGLPKDHIHRFDVLQDALLDVRNGKSDAAIGDLPAVRDMIRKGYPELETVGGVFVRENLGIVSRKNEAGLIAAVNYALGRLMVDGRYTRSYETWTLETMTTGQLAELEQVKSDGTPVPEYVPRSSAANPDAAPPAAPSGSAFTIRWSLLRQAFPWLLRGARLTLLLTLFTLLLGIPAGLIVALARVSGIAPLQGAASVYVEIVRGTPLLMQIYVLYFIFPAIHLNLSSLAAGVAALSLNAAAYISEIFRAGIQSIDTGQMEAARALGLDYPKAMRWVILPQTLRRVLPPLTNEAVALLKDSSLVSVVALTELMRMGREYATNAGSPTTIYLAVALLYLAMTLPLTWVARRLEAAWQPLNRSRVRAKIAKTGEALAHDTP